MSKGFPRPATTIGGPADAKMAAEILRYFAWVGLKGAARMRKSSLLQVWGSATKSAAVARQAVAVMGEGLSCHHHDHTA